MGENMVGEGCDSVAQNAVRIQEEADGRWVGRRDAAGGNGGYRKVPTDINRLPIEELLSALFHNGQQCGERPDGDVRRVQGVRCRRCPKTGDPRYLFRVYSF